MPQVLFPGGRTVDLVPYEPRMEGNFVPSDAIGSGLSIAERLALAVGPTPGVIVVRFSHQPAPGPGIDQNGVARYQAWPPIKS